MKILMVHNFYRLRGGECTVFEAERELLRDAGHDVLTYTRHSDEIDHYGPAHKLTLPLRTVWAWDSHRELSTLLSREAPDVAHFTNTFPLVSPSAYHACHAAGVPIVQSIHNYRWLCPAATLFRDGGICEECIDHSLLRSVRHGCYRGSRAASAVVATMVATHRQRTLIDLVDRFIALTEFARGKFGANGWPKERIAVKPNFVEIDGTASAPLESRRYALYAGRLSPEKGIDTLLDAWKRLEDPPPLRIAGDGPLRAALEGRVRSERISNVEFVGALPRDELLDALRGAAVLVFPSLWYEGMPMVLVEAFACGVPILASRLGGMAEMIDDDRTGLLFRCGDAADLAAKLGQIWANGEERTRIGHAARGEYEARYRADANRELLLEIYREAIAMRVARAGLEERGAVPD